MKPRTPAQYAEKTRRRENFRKKAQVLGSVLPIKKEPAREPNARPKLSRLDLDNIFYITRLNEKPFIEDEPKVLPDKDLEQ